MAIAAAWLAASAAQAQMPQFDNDDIGGVVTSASGPEAGVWVIAETDEFDTRYAKIVVTDDEGRYVLPDLPDADYEIWVRGYGLADSEKVMGRPGERHDLDAVIAPNEAVAAEVYPAIYWYAMMHLPTRSEVENIEGGLDFYQNMMRNNGCIGCHQLGQAATRTIPEAFQDMDSEAAWIRRVQSGQAGGQMIRQLASDLAGIPFKYLADWTDRVAAGELPAEAPPRPSGQERNIVATVRDWATETAYLHDLTTTDRRNPTVNAYGKIYGSPELSTDHFPILDPMANTDTSFLARPRDPNTPTTNDDPVVQPSAYWGDERIWDSQLNSHNPMIDQDGRVWYTARVRPPSEQPDFCLEGSDHPSAQVYPASRNAGRHLSVLDPETGDYTPINTCFG
ncbi:MAG: carboxypeptidase regulatory-like domain-containing protein, partial [Gammaproteobacteria bacterium]|nr:carboxypeptidase regulatory-like domain-containing protein [Gammaproteobacteria bacterium]